MLFMAAVLTGVGKDLMHVYSVITSLYGGFFLFKYIFFFCKWQNPLPLTVSCYSPRGITGNKAAYNPV